MAKKAALISRHRRAGWTVLFMLLIALTCFFTGIVLPFTSVTKLWLFDNQVSIYRGLAAFWNAGEKFLFLILLVFTICFPLIKINALLAIWLYPRLTADQAKGVYKFVSHLGKWSMLEVFVVATLGLTLRSSGLASIKVGSGFFLFCVSVMLTQFSSTWTGHIASQLRK